MYVENLESSFEQHFSFALIHLLVVLLILKKFE